MQAVSVPVIANGRCSWFSNQGSHFTTPYNQNNIFVRTARTSPFRYKIKVLTLYLKHFNTPSYFCRLAYTVYTWGVEINMHYRGAQILGARKPEFCTVVPRILRWLLGFWKICTPLMYHNSETETAQSVQWLGYGIGKVRSPAGARNFFLLQSVQTGPGSHPSPCPMNKRGSYHVGKVAGA